MKKIKLLILSAFVMAAVVLTFNVSPESNDEALFFLDDDNIALAEDGTGGGGGGYRCIPQTNWSCYIPGGQVGSFVPNFIWHS